MKKVLVIISKGFEEIEAVGCVDILRRADVDVFLAGLDELAPKGSHGIALECDLLLKDVHVEDFDMVLLPGGMPNAEVLANSPLVQELLRKFDDDLKFIAAICAAPLALDRAGVLKNAFTCYDGFEKIIKHKGYDKQKKVVVDGNIITAKGPATALEFALEIVKVLCGDLKFKKIEGELLMERG